MAKQGRLQAIKLSRSSDEGRPCCKGVLIIKQPSDILTGLSLVIGIGAIMATMLFLIGALTTDASSFCRVVGWNISPYLFLIILARLSIRSTLSASVVLVGTVLTAAFGAFRIYDAFYVHPDPQSGVVIFVLPYYLWAFCGLTVAAIIALHFMKWLVLPDRRETWASTDVLTGS